MFVSAEMLLTVWSEKKLNIGDHLENLVIGKVKKKKKVKLSL
jgi:hypothetical protein